MEVNAAQSRLGAYGKWQACMFTMVSVPSMFFATWHMLAIVYIGYVPIHYCNTTDMSMIPPQEEGLTGRLSSCHVYVDVSKDNETEQCTNGWTYVESLDSSSVVEYTGHTIVTQWDLVCSSSHLKDFSQSILVLGVMIGAMGFSVLADYVGRKPVFLFSLWAMVVVGVANAYVTNFYLFVALRFLTGCLQQGIGLIGIIIACELFAAKYRTFAGIMIENFWGMAACILALLGYFISDWRHLQLFVSLSGVLTIPLYWLLPESVIWLCANGRKQEAENILRKAYETNNMDSSKPILMSPGVDILEDYVIESKKGGLLEKIKQWRDPAKSHSVETDTAFYTMKDLLKHNTLRMYAVIMAILWFVISMVYYGLSLSTSSLSGNRFMTAFLSGIVEIPAYTSSFFVLQRWGRRYPLMVYLFVAGLSLLCSEVTARFSSDGSLAWLVITFSMIGKFGVTGAFGIVFLYASEMFPTTLRSQALGVASLFGRMGNLIATYTPFVAERVPWLPGPLLAGLSIGGGLIVLLLPETHNMPLPQTITDVENLSRKSTVTTFVAEDEPESRICDQNALPGDCAFYIEPA